MIIHVIGMMRAAKLEWPIRVEWNCSIVAGVARADLRALYRPFGVGFASPRGAKVERRQSEGTLELQRGFRWR